MITDERINLKLTCRNEEDLKVISAYLQDSIVTLKNIVFLKKNRTFVMMVNRFMWEDVEKGVFRQNKRIRSAIKFQEVIEVKSQNINQKNEKRILECLAIKCNKNLDKNYVIKIFFSGGGIITIVSEVIDILLDDLGKPWNVKHFPSHKI